MNYLRWYDKNPELKMVLELIEKLDKRFQGDIAQEVLQILMNDYGMNLDEKINNIANSYNFDCQRWYDENIDLFTSFELIRTMDMESQNIIADRIKETILQMGLEKNYD